jgi:hypothetical protein
VTANANSNPEQTPPREDRERLDSSENLSDSELRAKYGTYGSRKAALSKREMMEALSRERFPWEE